MWWFTSHDSILGLVPFQRDLQNDLPKDTEHRAWEVALKRQRWLYIKGNMDWDEQVWGTSNGVEVLPEDHELFRPHRHPRSLKTLQIIFQNGQMTVVA